MSRNLMSNQIKAHYSVNSMCILQLLYLDISRAEVTTFHACIATSEIRERAQLTCFAPQTTMT